MRNVLNLVAFANPDDVSEVVLDDAEVIAMIVDVGGKEKRIATAHDALLAQIGRPPVDFQTQLVRLHDLWRLRKPLSKLCEERHVAMRRSFVVDERGVGQLIRPALGGALDESQGALIVPRLLSAQLVRDSDQRQHSDKRAKPHGGKLTA